MSYLKTSRRWLIMFTEVVCNIPQQNMFEDNEQVIQLNFYELEFVKFSQQRSKSYSHVYVTQVSFWVFKKDQKHLGVQDERIPTVDFFQVCQPTQASFDLKDSFYQAFTYFHQKKNISYVLGFLNKKINIRQASANVVSKFVKQ